MTLHLFERPEMTLHEFQAFADLRPDDERWELIDGEPVLNAAPSFTHQSIVANLIEILRREARQAARSWTAIPGLGLALSPVSAPVPDVLVRPRTALQDWKCDDAIAVFEVLSPSTAKRDLSWKRDAYASLPSLSHYVVFAQDRIEARAFDRAERWAERRLDAESVVALSALGVDFPLRVAYEGLAFG